MDTWQREEFKELSKDQLIDFIEMSSKNFWTLQNNWMMNVENKFGKDVAIELDGICYGRAVEVQVYRLKKFFGLGDDLEALVKALKFSIHGLYAEGVEYELLGNRAIRRVRRCPNQLRREKEGLSEIPCKPALIATHTRIAHAVNPNITIGSVMAPPDPHQEDLHCEIEYIYQK
jgi:hypothetical protein